MMAPFAAFAIILKDRGRSHDIVQNVPPDWPNLPFVSRLIRIRFPVKTPTVLAMTLTPANVPRIADAGGHVVEDMLDAVIVHDQGSKNDGSTRALFIGQFSYIHLWIPGRVSTTSCAHHYLEVKLNTCDVIRTAICRNRLVVHCDASSHAG